jgi:hypothetical protein
MRILHVLVGEARHAEFDQGIEKSLLLIAEGRVEDMLALDVDRSGVAVNRAVGKILVRLHALEHGQHFVPRPLRIALGRPSIEIGLDRPRDRHHVHR